MPAFYVWDLGTQIQVFMCVWQVSPEACLEHEQVIYHTKNPIFDLVWYRRSTP